MRPVSLPEIRYLLWSLPLRAGTDTVRRSMPALLVALLAALRSFVRSRLELEAEILALRHQLAVLQRQAPRRPRLGRADRLLWVLLSRLWPNWRGAIQIVTPDTVVRWHRRGFALYWCWKSRPRRAGRPGGGRRHPRADPADARGQPSLGRTPHPRRVAEARAHAVTDDGGEVPGTSPPSPVADVAHLPRQPRLSTRLGRLLHRPHRHVSGVVRVRGVVARPPAHRPLERDGASDRGVDRATAPRGVAVGHGAAIPRPRPRWHLRLGAFRVSRRPWASTKS